MWKFVNNFKNVLKISLVIIGVLLFFGLMLIVYTFHQVNPILNDIEKNKMEAIYNSPNGKFYGFINDYFDEIGATDTLDPLSKAGYEAIGIDRDIVIDAEYLATKGVSEFKIVLCTTILKKALENDTPIWLSTLIWFLRKV